MGEAAQEPAGSQEKTGVWSRVSRHPFWSALIAGILCVVLGVVVQPAAKRIYHLVRPVHHPVVLAGWGPLRPVYWCKQPTICDGADHVVFNSYVNTPNYGDERAFVRVKPAQADSASAWTHVLHVSAGETLSFLLYINNAAWEGRVPPGQGIAHGTRARVDIPLGASRTLYVYGFVSARNARPSEVWDGATLEADRDFRLRYVFGSARLFIGRHDPVGMQVPDALMEDGTPIGSNGLTGDWGDSFTDGGILTFRVRVLPG